MMKRLLLAVILGLAVLTPMPAPAAADEPAYSRKEVIYGRKFGTALTMDVFTPKKDANGAGVVFVVSGGWYSDHNGITALLPLFSQPLLDRGYTVFAVCHGSNPKYTIPEILEDMHRSVRFIRYNAKEYGIDPQRIGITRRLGRRPPVADAGLRRQGRQPQGRRPRRPRDQPRPSRRLPSIRRPTSSTGARRAR